MLLLSVFLFFCTVFVFVHNQFPFRLEQPYIKDLITSFASYARINGHVPSDDKQQIPWEEIGISSSFFNISKKMPQYRANKEYQNKDMMPYDSIYWFIDKITYRIQELREYVLQLPNNPKCMTQIANQDVITLHIRTANIDYPIQINKTMLFKYAMWEESYCNIPFRNSQIKFWEMVSAKARAADGCDNNIEYSKMYIMYPQYRAMVLGYAL